MNVNLLRHISKPVSNKAGRHISKPGSDKAFKFVRRDTGADVWIPKSVIRHISQRTVPDANGLALVLVDVEDWFAEKEGL